MLYCIKQYANTGSCLFTVNYLHINTVVNTLFNFVVEREHNLKCKSDKLTAWQLKLASYSTSACLELQHHRQMCE